MNQRQLCKRCLYDDRIPSISFDADGVCNYCAFQANLDAEYPIGEEGDRRLRALVSEIRQAGRGKKFDCVVGVSGGCDSSYLIHRCVELGLRPLAVHFDNTWNSPIATQNIYKVLGKLNVELYTHVVNNKEYDDLYRSFFEAGVPDLEAPTDIGLATTMYEAAEKYGIKYIIEGHVFRTEGTFPLGWLYFDGKYIESVHARYGTRPLKTYPNLDLYRFLKWSIVKQLKRVRPLYFMDYQKEQVKRFLAETYGWEWYGGHHLENRFTAFYHSYFLPRRFHIDSRIVGWSAMVRSGQLDRDEGFALLREPPACDPELVDLVQRRLGYSGDEFHRVMTLPHRSYREFETYKQFFERFRWLFWALYKLNRVPKSFYLKYVRKELSQHTPTLGSESHAQGQIAVEIPTPAGGPPTRG